MISGVAFCPQAPLLVPAVTGGSCAALDELRLACRTALRRVADGHRVAVVGAGTACRVHTAASRGSLARFGVPVERALGAPAETDPAKPLPAALTIGAWLIADAVGARGDTLGFEVGPDFAGSVASARLREFAATGEVAVLVVGDGSAHRGLAGNAQLAERARAFDAATAGALAAGEPDGLVATDEAEAAALSAAGAPAWTAVGALLADGAGRRYAADVLYDGAPFGVGYLVATWTALRTRPGGGG